MENKTEQGWELIEKNLQGRRVWLYKPGEQGSKWELMLERGLMGIGWSKLGDLSHYTKEQIKPKLDEFYPIKKESGRKNDVKTLYDFANEIKIGDVVLAMKGTTQILGYGEVMSDYFYDTNKDTDTSDKFCSFREVKWTKKGLKVGRWAIKTLTDITKYQETQDVLYKLDLTSADFADLIQFSNIPLNQILYGPPGTGKTYGTIDKVLEILCECGEIDSIPQERDEKKALFDKFMGKEQNMEQGQIGFVTFHQSYGYEDFVEGIRPRLGGENDESQTSEKMEYEIKDGIFKKMCKEAQTKGVKITGTTKVWKMSLGEKSKGEAEELQKHCFDSGVIRIGFDNIDDKTSVPNFYAMSVNDIVCVLHDNKTISLVGVISGGVEEDEGVKLSNHSTDYFKRFRKVRWLNTLDDRIDIYALNGNTKLARKTTYPLDIKPEKILALINKPYILIIDEINRGNISKILGELITLLEPSKRKGNDEALEVKLPYSQESFSVPNNLYIIGTMNTADRSIALLDTALRRRFEFIEMLPDSKELSTNCDSINLQELLKAMNNRMEFLLDRERSIGHAFFIGVTNLNDLQAVFKHKILPLLQEYFYDDYAKINAVLNDNGMLESQTMNDVKISLSEEFVDSEKRIWKITDSSSWAQWQFQKIYDTNAKPAESKESLESSNEPSEK